MGLHIIVLLIGSLEMGWGNEGGWFFTAGLHCWAAALHCTAALHCWAQGPAVTANPTDARWNIAVFDSFSWQRAGLHRKLI